MEFFLLLIAIPALTLSFLLGFILAIINFRRKKLSIEIIAWICTSILIISNLILLFNSSPLGIFPMGVIDSQVFSIPIFLLLFLLFQYRSDQAKDIQTFRFFYTLKSFCLTQILSAFISITVSMLYSNQSLSLDKPENRQMLSYFISGFNLILYTALLTVIVYRYLKTVSPLPVMKSLFTESLTLVIVIIMANEIWGITTTILRFHNIEWLNITYLLTTTVFVAFECAVSALIGSYLHLSKADKDSV
ncbi:hypothetical protein [Pedobacter punctiformis]|uniref:Uncharacterized protein n=1 Tax=Pedobacter punctiformis TaxID=3004097 RepID=A0ABT4LAV2_9SPHI|nr:hypothetical protein [Pedobacter sp. HCMS5-2]MCZ4245038.1 hypothetical protein [Pedobacter sp. HCMS5-2]